MILRNNKGVMSAVLKNDTLIKKVDSRVHKLHFIDGYAIDRRIIEQAQKAGCGRVEIHEIDTGKVLSVGMEQFVLKSVQLNLGHGRQFGLAGDYWTEQAKGQVRLI